MKNTKEVWQGIKLYCRAVKKTIKIIVYAIGLFSIATIKTIAFLINSVEWERKDRRIKLAYLIAFVIVSNLVFALGGVASTPEEVVTQHNELNRLPEIAEVDFDSLSVQQQIRIIAQEECGDLGKSCVDDLEAMAFVESEFNPDAEGDNYQSFGILQIHKPAHLDVLVSDMFDIKFSLQWTLDRMKHYGYPEKRDYAIMKHNGTPYTPATLYYLWKVNNYLNK